MKILRNGEYFAEGTDLQQIADVGSEDVSLYSFHPDDYRAHKLAEINAAFEIAAAGIKASYPESEVLSWDKQEKEARDFLADPQAVTPQLDAMAETRGLDKTELANRIVSKADSFAVSSGQIIGKRQALEDQLKAMTTWSEMKDIAW